jgi:hypothetical protein
MGATHRHDLKIAVVKSAPDERPANAAEAVNADPDSHALPSLC